MKLGLFVDQHYRRLKDEINSYIQYRKFIIILFDNNLLEFDKKEDNKEDYNSKHFDN